jgi:putative aldouronate transport system permease protein
MLIPNAVSVWNLIITRTYFHQNIPDELSESAFIDGCSHSRFFIFILMPLSKVIVAVIGLFYAVNHWNGFFQALIYLSDKNLFPLQLLLRDILIQQQQLAFDPEVAENLRRTADLIKYCMLIVACAPVLLVYPFLQKYFVKGIMLGSLKG